MLSLALCATLSTPGSANEDTAGTLYAVPHYVDATGVAGLSHSYSGSTDYVVGGGAAAFDCDDDGRADLALAGAEEPLALYRNASAPGRPAFTRLDRALRRPVTGATGVYPLDMDSDGKLDLFVLRFGQNMILHGLGNCRFTDATSAFGLPDRADWTTAFAAHWFGDDRMPTLFIGNYVPRDRPLQKSGNCEENYLLRPSGPDAATYGAPEPLGPGACTLSALFVDWSGTGRFDLRLANDREYYDRGLSEQLWTVEGGTARAFGKAEGWDDVSLWGMGIAADDLTGDGRPEMLVTSMADNRLEALTSPDSGQPKFENIARDLNSTAQRPYAGPDARPSTAWHTAFGDANNDGYSDLFIVKGNVDEMPKMANFDPDNLLLGGPDGFVEAGFEAGIAVDTKGRGGLFEDLTGNGALDILTVNRNQPVRFFANRTALGNWIAIDPRQTGTNPFAVSARVEVETALGPRSRTRLVGGGHAGGSLLPLHIGLGDARSARLRIRWPDGTFGDWVELEAGQVHRIDKRAAPDGAKQAVSQ
ncbi:hypothetical protein GSH16_03815 [Rhodobacteraceae bacterium KN286]|uniref:ASPIC/UnbV domain-containing protein n=1 Tax=Oceanomicrobium pacificus TaxID=2692916 RepID=A0A6B0TTJ7_9RHOB|nr:hypothetical protein [Oceanomicrobium pacificus]